MKNLIKTFCLLFVLSGCSYLSTDTEKLQFNPDYNKYIQNVSVSSHSPDHVTYEYKNIRVDELAALAALYCQDKGDKRAYLDKIVLQRNNSRLATFICRYDDKK